MRASVRRSLPVTPIEMLGHNLFALSCTILCYVCMYVLCRSEQARSRWPSSRSGRRQQLESHAFHNQSRPAKARSRLAEETHAVNWLAGGAYIYIHMSLPSPHSVTRPCSATTTTDLLVSTTPSGACQRSQDNCSLSGSVGGHAHTAAQTATPCGPNCGERQPTCWHSS